MECRNHPQEAAVNRCVGCAEPFCANCLVPIGGQSYCSACKVLALNGRVPLAAVSEPTTPCKEANEALIFSLVGIVCVVGFILEPIAIYKAIQARRQIAADPDLKGAGKATAALVIALSVLGLLLLGLINKANS